MIEGEVKTHVESIIGTNNIKVESMKSRGQYASFELNVPAFLYDQIIAGESWPVNTCVKP